MQVEHFIFSQGDFITHDIFQRRIHFFFRAAEINIRGGMAPENPELMPEADIGGRPVDPLNRRTRGDGQSAVIKPLNNVTVTKSHGIILIKLSVYHRRINAG